MVENIGDFLDNVANKKFSDAEKQFSDMINTRLADRLESHKAMIANQVYNGIDPDEDLELEDEDEIEVETEEEETEEDAEL
tara:strand:+ start:515 stop:757 length:243 start_codon:yes stop_codon:yes gene_type:complete